MNNSEIITSRGNARLAAARKVRDGKDRARIFIEGRRLAAEALRSPIEIVECLVSDEFNDADLTNAVADRTLNVAVVAQRIFKTITDTNEPQGIVIIAKRPTNCDLDRELQTARLPIVLFLNEINNPSNLGAIMRTAEAAGVAGAIVSANSADVFSPKSIRSAMGSSFRVPIRQNDAFEDVINWSKERELITTAADISATQTYTDIDWSQPRLLIFGSEADGLTMQQLASVDDKILIPMENAVESLNLGVSAGILLFEAKRETTS